MLHPSLPLLRSLSPSPSPSPSPSICPSSSPSPVVIYTYLPESIKNIKPYYFCDRMTLLYPFPDVWWNSDIQTILELDAGSARRAELINCEWYYKRFSIFFILWHVSIRRGDKKKGMRWEKKQINATKETRRTRQNKQKCAKTNEQDKKKLSQQSTLTERV